MKSSKKFHFPRSRSLPTGKLHEVYKRLRKRFGHQKWWPGESPFEMMVGAILTQNTAWRNVEKAIMNLKQAGKLNLGAMKNMTEAELAKLIQPSGFFNIKAKRLKSFVSFVHESYGGDLSRMLAAETYVLREKLLSVSGIGRETADSILLYAANKPVFVIDAYTKRIFSRHRVALPKAILKKHGLSSRLANMPNRLASLDYEVWRSLFEEALPQNTELFNDYHAQIVRVAKDFCRSSKVFCGSCPLNKYL